MTIKLIMLIIRTETVREADLHLWRLPVGGAAAPASSLTLMEAVDFGSFIVVCIGCYTFISFVYMLEGCSFITFIMFGFRSGLRLEGKY